MAFSNSPLVNIVRLTEDYSSGRYHNRHNPKGVIDKITIHHMAGNLTVERCGELFATSDREVSSNYGIGTDGRIGLYVEEKNRPWTSSSPANDYHAVTIEVANDKIGGDWHVSDKALAATIKLCVDICKRNGIKKLNFTGDATGNLTMHCYFTATSCPGPYLKRKFKYIADEVNKQLSAAVNSSTAAVNKADTADKTKSDVKYRVQAGAFSKEANAKSQVTKIKKAGFDACVMKSGSNWIVQAGAFSKKANAEAIVTKLKAKGFEAIIKEVSTSATKPTAVKKVTEKCKVKVKKGAKTYTGGTLRSFVYDRIHIVSELNGDRAVITYGGVVVAAINTKDLIVQ